VTAESWCGCAAGIDGPTWVMATYKIADCNRYIPYPIYQADMIIHLPSSEHVAVNKKGARPP
jgi:hypothetical protein